MKSSQQTSYLTMDDPSRPLVGGINNTEDEEPELTKISLVRHIYRRFMFYLFLFVWVFAVCRPSHWYRQSVTLWTFLAHVLYFDLDLEARKNTYLVRFLHGLSFCGSFAIASMFTAIVGFLNTGFVDEGAQDLGWSTLEVWILAAVIHYLPPILLLIDLFLSRRPLQLRHDLRIKYVCNFVWKITWFYVSTPILLGAWVLAGYTPIDEYHTDKDYWEVFISLAAVSCAVGAVIMVAFLRNTDEDNEVDTLHIAYDRDA